MSDTLSKINKSSILVENSINNKIFTDLKKTNHQELKDVAEQFEAIFVHQMLKQARQSKLADGLFNSDAQDTFNNMVEIEYSKILSKKNNFGIAEALIKQFQPHLQLKKDK